MLAIGRAIMARPEMILLDTLMKQVRLELETLLASDRDSHIAINLSPCHFETDKILKTSSRIFGSSAILPEQIIYEITERGLVAEDSGVARDVMNRLRTANLSHLPVIVGGIIPEDDRHILKQLGVAAVYTPKDFHINTMMSDIVKLIDARSDDAAA